MITYVWKTRRRLSRPCGKTLTVSVRRCGVPLKRRKKLQGRRPHPPGVRSCRVAADVSGNDEPRSCNICTHPDREAIDEALVGGVGFSTLIAKYRVSKDSLSRHKGNHLPASLVMARAAEEVARADSLLDQVRTLQSRAYGILDKAEGTGDLRTALGAIREARGNLELLAKLLGELDERPQVNILVSPEWLSLRTKLLYALNTYPEARGSVLRVLEGVGDGGG
jgi:hypothetical protein